MPFLFVWPKQREIVVDSARLASLLCPYRGGITRHELAGGELYSSSLADVEPQRVAIPSGTKQTAQTAWLEIRVDATGAHFETDPLATFPLWVVDDDAFIAVTCEVKSLCALGFTPAFEPEQWPASRKRPPNYSPYANVRRVFPGAALHISPT